MGKKKRQEFHSAVLDKPKDHEGVKSCVHIAKGINLNRLKPKRNSKLQQKRLGIPDSPPTEDKESLWLCLKCAQMDCGRKQHTDNKPADLHTISFNINTKKAWCNVCNVHFGPKDNQKVNRALQYLQQHLEDTSEEYESAKIEGKILYEPEEEEEEKKNFKGVVKSSLDTPRGLKNLGNTCYFNVVLQCLARTPNFIFQMEKLKEERIINLETNMLQDDSENTTEVKLKMDKWMDFSDLLLKSLVELNMPERKPYVPIKLLNELHRVSNTITKDEQHDAHELLREVLQKIKEVDLQRVKSAILKNFKSANTMSKERMDEAVQLMIKSYENHTTKKAFLEEMFGGILVSILKCQECGNTSYTNEPFLDLSLPITDKTITSFEMNVNKDINTNPRKKQDFQQQKKKCKATVNKEKPQKNEETEHSEADVEDSFDQGTRNSWNEESGYDQENLEYSLKSPLSSRSSVPSIDNDEKVLSLSSPCINSADGAPAVICESSMSSGKGDENKCGEHKDCIKNLNSTNIDATLGAPAERIMTAVEGVESKVSEHKRCMKDLALSSPCCNGTSCSKNLGVKPATPEDKSESIMITAEATEIKDVEHEDYMKYLALSSPCSKSAGTPLRNSNCIMNAAEESESQDREHEDSEKNLVATTTCLSSLCRESTESPLSDRDTPSPVSSEINIDCSVSIRMHAGCSSPVSPDCNGYRPVSRFAFCDDVDSVARCSPVNEISSMSLKAAMNELNSKSSNHTVSPVKLSTRNETSCNDSEFLECSGESNSLSVIINEYSGVNLNQTEILESVEKLNLNDGDNLGFCVPLNYTNAKAGKMSPEIKQKRRKNQSSIRPAQEKSPEYDASRFTLTCCLENFTALELMTDCEKVACSHCTAKNGEGEIVFTTSTKQMQIKSTPAVLILHLKRFEFKTDGGCSKTRKSTRPKKLNRHIQFPIVLDVSPYIYSENKEQNLRPRQKKSLYSLYAVIEHTGSINQGHYIVYIKGKAAKTDPSHLKDMNENEYEKGAGMSLPAKWFSISDESVQKVDEKDVLKAQAYILFYEKCW